MASHLPRAVLFDLDDTLLDHHGCADSCWAVVCATAATELSRACANELRAEIWTFAKWYWSEPERALAGRMDMRQACTDILAGALRHFQVEAPEMSARLAAIYLEQMVETIALLPDALDVLDHLRRQGARLALITNGHQQLQRRKIERHGLASQFDCILVEGEFGSGKPEERVFRHVLDQLGACPEEAWMVGDNLEADIVGAQRLGIQAIWRDRAGEGVPNGSPVRPDRVIRELRELID